MRGGGGVQLPGVRQDQPGEEGGVQSSLGLLEPPGHPSLSDHGGAEGARGPGLVTGNELTEDDCSQLGLQYSLSLQGMGLWSSV